MKSIVKYAAVTMLLCAATAFGLSTNGVEQIQVDLPRIEFYKQINETVCDIVDAVNSFAVKYVARTGAITTVSISPAYDSTNGMFAIPFYQITPPNLNTASCPISVSAMSSNAVSVNSQTNFALFLIGTRNAARQ